MAFFCAFLLAKRVGENKINKKTGKKQQFSTTRAHVTSS